MTGFLLATNACERARTWGEGVPPPLPLGRGNGKASGTYSGLRVTFFFSFPSFAKEAVKLKIQREGWARSLGKSSAKAEASTVSPPTKAGLVLFSFTPVSH